MIPPGLFDRIAASVNEGRWQFVNSDDGSSVFLRRSPSGKSLPDDMRRRVLGVAVQAKIVVGDRLLVGPHSIDFNPPNTWPQS